jgi:hypothetical protein
MHVCVCSMVNFIVMGIYYSLIFATNEGDAYLFLVLSVICRYKFIRFLQEQNLLIHLKLCQHLIWIKGIISF